MLTDCVQSVFLSRGVMNISDAERKVQQKDKMSVK